MNKYEEAKAVVLGALTLYMCHGLLNKKERTKASSIRLFQCIRQKTAQKPYLEYVKMSNDVWENVKKRYGDVDVHIVIFQATENLVFDNLELMEKFYGKAIGLLASSFCLKQTKNGIKREYIKETNMFTDALIKEVEDLTRKFYGSGYVD